MRSYYLSNGQNRQTNFFFGILDSFLKTDAESCLRKNLAYKSILYNSIELSGDWTSTEFQNQTTLFQKKD